ncbi:4Fe-4S dicluster domain-containing protein [Kushneria indalinina]|uniref:Tetrathionate reductase subunit B n=1 Tax=Kushneria indalinina DSM 14324 TaxID=1122140 RepID=A0A3D9DWK2_9GAMM|nr:4Fe-4S dicluster domain-containing protein [Kushneria indalinina]REC95160.1 tetrathionate reductase subunit B [Kushneria indalinina DSM 14324]
MTTSSPHWQMAVDLERCIGCHACSVACKVENDIELGVFRTRVLYHDHGAFPATRRSFLPTLCMQCADAPCMTACPSGAIRRSDDGIVHIDPDTCDKWESCIGACPYGALHIDPVQGIANKCDFCSHRLEQSMAPACVEACPADVLIFGDINDDQSPVSRFYQRYDSELNGLRVERGTQPQVRYRGIGTVVPQAAVDRLPDGRPHDPLDYEIDRWAER